MIGARATQRLALVPWSHAEHGPAMREMNAEPAVMRFLGGPATPAESDAVSQRLEAHWNHYGYGLWAVGDSGGTYGFVGLSHPLWLPGWEHEIEVGWRLRSDAWGRGFATEAAREAIAVALDELSLARVICLVHPDNAASLAVARKLALTESTRIAHPSRPHELIVLERGPG